MNTLNIDVKTTKQFNLILKDVTQADKHLQTACEVAVRRAHNGFFDDANYLIGNLPDLLASRAVTYFKKFNLSVATGTRGARDKVVGIVDKTKQLETFKKMKEFAGFGLTKVTSDETKAERADKKDKTRKTFVENTVLPDRVTEYLKKSVSVSQDYADNDAIVMLSLITAAIRNRELNVIKGKLVLKGNVSSASVEAQATPYDSKPETDSKPADVKEIKALLDKKFGKDKKAA